MSGPFGTASPRIRLAFVQIHNAEHARQASQGT